MAYAIMRCKKLASMGSVASALKHCYRERETPNADASKTPQNAHHAARSTDEAMGKLRDLLPAKRRKDAVLAVEYLMTASPQWWKQASQEQQQGFFQQSRQWLADKFGEKNIIVATIHRDETSPHLSAFVVPLTRDGRLSAKDFIGNKGQMSQDQTTYAEGVRQFGLERGLEGSKATHTTIREYYTRANAPGAVKTPNIDLPESKLLESKESYGKRVAEAAFTHVGPELVALRAQAGEKVAAEKRAQEAVATSRHLLGRVASLEQTLQAAGDSIRQNLDLAKLISPKEMENLRERQRRRDQAQAPKVEPVRQVDQAEAVRSSPNPQKTPDQGRDR